MGHSCQAAIDSICKHLESKGAAKEQVERISIDLSPSFIAGSAASFPAIQITFDRFHVAKLLNEAINSHEPSADQRAQRA